MVMEKLQYNKKLLEEWKHLESYDPEVNIYLSDLSEKIISDKKEKFLYNSEIGNKNLNDAIDLNILIIKDGYIVFHKPEILVYYYIRKLLKNISIITTDDFIELLDAIYKIFYFNNKFYEFAKSLIIIILNNEIKFNISKQLFSYNEDYQEKVFWKIIYPYSYALPFLSVEPEDLILMLNLYVEKSQNSFNSTEIEISLTDYVSNQLEKGLKLYEMLLNSPKEKAISFIPFITLGFSKRMGLESSYHYAFDLIKNGNIEIAKQGIYACSLFNYDSEESKKILKITLNKYCAIIDEENINLIPSVINGIRILLKYDKNLKNYILKLSKIKNPNIQLEISKLLWIHESDSNEEDWFLESLNNFADLNIEYKRIIQNIAYILHSIVKKNPIYIFEFFEKWIINHDFELNNSNGNTLSKLFNYVTLDLFEYNTDLFNEYLTKWYNNENSKYHAATANVIHDLSVHKHNDFKLSKKILNNLKTEDIHFIVLKILGYVFDYKLLCPLVFSVLEKDEINSDICNIVQSYFDNYIAYNFPGYSRGFLNLKIIEGNEVEKNIARKILNNLSKYQDDLKRLPHLKEFESSNFRKEKFYRLRSEKRSKQIEQAQNECTSLFNMIRHTIIKGGKSSFTKFEGKFTKKTFLNQYKTSFEVPMAELLDPIEQSFFRYQCRIIKKYQCA